jgi:hypothetical protein
MMSSGPLVPTRANRHACALRHRAMSHGELVARHTGSKMPDAARRDGGDSWVGSVKGGDARVVLQAPRR